MSNQSFLTQVTDNAVQPNIAFFQSPKSFDMSKTYNEIFEACYGSEVPERSFDEQVDYITYQFSERVQELRNMSYQIEYKLRQLENAKYNAFFKGVTDDIVLGEIEARHYNQFSKKLENLIEEYTLMVKHTDESVIDEVYNTEF